MENKLSQYTESKTIITPGKQSTLQEQKHDHSGLLRFYNDYYLQKHTNANIFIDFANNGL